MRRLLLAVPTLALLGTVLPAPPSALAQSQSPPQALRVALREDPDILDPTLARTYVSRIVFTAVCDKLFDTNEKLEIVPQLATGYEWASPTELVIRLRPDVQFQDGEKLDAEAVRYSLNRHLTMSGSFRRSEVNAMDRVEVVDPLTVKVVLKQASSPFLAQLTDRAGMIVSPKAAEAAGKDFGLKPVCAGPFRFVERVPQDHITVERFPGYWNKDAVKLDRVTYQVIPDGSVRLANLQANSVDLVEYVVPTDVPAVKKDARLRLSEANGLGYMGITFNLSNGARSKTAVGQDARVRRAFELALDKEALVQVVYNGLFETTAQAVPDGSPFFNAALKPQNRDVARAKALLKDAGVATPLVVQLTVPNSPDMRQVGEIVQSMAAEAGFDVRITATEFATGLAAATRGDFEATVVGWSGRIDPDGNLFSFLHSGGALNDSKYANPKMDELLEAARATPDPAARRALYAQVGTTVAQDLPILYIWQLRNLVGMSARVQGFRPSSDGMLRLQGMSLSK